MGGTAFTTDGCWIISCSEDGGIQLWNPETGDALFRINLRDGSGGMILHYCHRCANNNDKILVRCVDTSSAGDSFATVHWNRYLRIWRFRQSPVGVQSFTAPEKDTQPVPR